MFNYGVSLKYLSLVQLKEKPLLKNLNQQQFF